MLTFEIAKLHTYVLMLHGALLGVTGFHQINLLIRDLDDSKIALLRELCFLHIAKARGHNFASLI